VRLEKQQLRQRWSELRALINEWDPIGLIEAGAPPDEYECVSGPLLRRLEERAGTVAIAEYLSAELADHFGVPISDAPVFAAKVVSWYEKRWPTTEAA
jgi:hypothetical protein